MATPLFTIFTPTYNRAHTLPRVYESITAQTFRDFEWVVVDDGSTDNSAELIAGWAAEADFPIRYFHQTNGHKKTAFNHGVREARGELFLCWDSDDTAPADALRIFHDRWNSIPEAERGAYVGVTGLCIDEQGVIVGDSYPTDPYDSDTLSSTLGDGIGGEKWGFQRTAVLREYPFPEFIEGLVGEGLIWNAIARKYRTRYVNDVVRIYHIEQDSLIHSRKTVAKMRGVAEGQCFAAADFADHEWRWFFRAPIKVLKVAANHGRFSLHLRRGGGSVRHSPRTFPGRFLALLAWPIGFVAFLYDELGSS
ncbi:glycosyltransferase family 2 protein [Sphingopyxis granuli]|uniref:Glycosyl transferase n=1 Tax=Sphingopyxis granuli TaxID=267128 RepID=A0AA86GME1_9SPHN|nr:glycosyltransferase family A protein [Sphingopyxis granuli]AMG74735.1 Glycosyl transferase [Sphingopyxis granuli]